MEEAALPGVDHQPEESLQTFRWGKTDEHFNSSSLSFPLLARQEKSRNPEVVANSQTFDQPHHELGQPVVGNVPARVDKGGEQAKTGSGQLCSAVSFFAGSCHGRNQHFQCFTGNLLS